MKVVALPHALPATSWLESLTQRIRSIAWRRVGVRVAQGVVAFFVLYLVGVNVFSRTRLFRDAINTKPNSLLIEYASAYSLFPGIVHAEGVSIRGRDTVTEWRLQVDRCDFRMSLTDLAIKTFHATRVRASGVAFRIRLRLDESDSAADALARLPPIDGFADPPRTDVGPPPAPLTDEKYNLWSVRLDDVDAEHVREVWIHTIRSLGEMRVRGRWYLRPLRQLEVAAAAVDVDGVDVLFGPDPLVTHVHGSIGATAHPMDLQRTSGLAMVKYISADVRLAGELPLAEAMVALTRMKGVDRVRGGGPVDGRVVVDHGVLQRETYVRVDSPQTVVDVAGLAFTASVATVLSIEDIADAKLGVRVESRASGLSVTENGKEYARAVALTSTLTSNERDITLHFADARLLVDLDGAESHALPAWAAKLPPMAGIAIQSGDATAAAHIEGRLAEARFFGGGSFGISRLTTTRGKDRVVATLGGDVKLVEMSFADKRLDFSGSRVVAKDIVATVLGIEIRAPSIESRADRAIVTRGARPDVDIAVDAPGTDVSAARAINDAIAPTNAFHATSVHAHVSGRATFSLSKHSASGAASVDAPHLACRIKGVDVGGSLLTHVVVRKWDWANDEIDFSGSDLRLRDVLAGSTKPDHPLRALELPLLTVRAPRLTIGSKGVLGLVVADMPRAELPDLSLLQDVLPMPKGVTIEAGRAHAHLHVALDLSSYATHGKVEVASQAVRVRVGPEVLTGDVSGDVHARSGSAPGSVLLSGTTVALTNIAIQGRPTSGWWGSFDLRDAQLDTRHGLRFQAIVHSSARDALPIAEPLLSISGLPRWVGGLVNTQNLDATADLRADASAFDVRSLVARGQGVTVRLAYARHDGHAKGAVLIDTGLLDVGVGLHDGGTNVVLLGAKSWYSRQATCVERYSSSEGGAGAEGAAGAAGASPGPDGPPCPSP